MMRVLLLIVWLALPVVAESGRDPVALYNQGTKLAQQGELSQGLILLYRAQTLAPRDADIAHNIDQLQAQVVANPLKQTGWSVGAHSLTVVEWLNLCLLLIALTQLLAWLSRRHAVPGTRLGGWVLLAGLVLVVIFTVQQIKHQHFSEHGVIIESKVAVKVGPSATLDTLFYLHEGVHFQVIKQIDTWTKLSLPNGLSGWIPSDQLDLI